MVTAKGAAVVQGSVPPGTTGKLSLGMPFMQKSPPHDAVALTAKDPQGHELWTWVWSEGSIDRSRDLVTDLNSVAPPQQPKPPMPLPPPQATSPSNSTRKRASLRRPPARKDLLLPQWPATRHRRSGSFCPPRRCGGHTRPSPRAIPSLLRSRRKPTAVTSSSPPPSTAR